jgi:hypothetical protein
LATIGLPGGYPSPRSTGPAQGIEAHEHAAQGQREAAEPLAPLPEVPAEGIKEYAADDLRGGYRRPVNSGLTAVVIFNPALAR